MTEDKLSLIRTTIAASRAEEERTHELERFLALLTPRLHNAITLPTERPAAALLNFVIRYIERAPDFLEALEQAMVKAGVASRGRVFLEIAMDFFLQPPEVVHQDGGLRSLIDEAYLTHRLTEEVNDRLVVLCGTPLAPMDMTMANLVVHHLLGDDFANQLDLAVHYAVEALLRSEYFGGDSTSTQVVARRTGSNWSEEKWPCLAEDSDIYLSFSSRLASVTEH
jgi:hypothetical protein